MQLEDFQSLYFLISILYKITDVETMQISLLVEILSSLQFLYYNRLKKYATFITMKFLYSI